MKYFNWIQTQKKRTKTKIQTQNTDTDGVKKKSFLCYRDQHLHRIRAKGSIRIRCGFSDKSLELYGPSGRHNSLSSQSIDIFHRSFMG